VERTLTPVATSHSKGPEPSRPGLVNRRRSTLKTLEEIPEDQAALQAPRLEHLVQRVSAHETILHQEQGDAVVSSAAALDLVITPGGPRHKSLIHIIEPGHEVHFEYRKITRPFPPTSSAHPLPLCSRWCPRLASARTAPRAPPTLASTPPGRARGAPRHRARTGRVAGDGRPARLGRLETGQDIDRSFAVWAWK
jgi:hypothetical protein